MTRPLRAPTPSGRRNPLTGELKDPKELADLIESFGRQPTHQLTTTRVSDDLHIDEPGLYDGSCICGWTSERPRSQSLIRAEYQTHRWDAPITERA